MNLIEVGYNDTNKLSKKDVSIMYSDKVKAEIYRIKNLFQTGNIVPALETVFLAKQEVNSSIPMFGWSYRNLLLALVIYNATDARSFNSWKEVGRTVKAGKSFNILVPNTRKVKTLVNGQEIEEVKIFGYIASPRWNVADTEGEPLLEQENKQPVKLNELPFYDYAKSKGIQVIAYHSNAEKGYYMKGQIGLAVTNENTWLHELYHMVEDDLGMLNGDKAMKEVSAQLGASVIAKMIGREDITDLGKTFNYIGHWGNAKTPDEVANLCLKVIDRVSKVVEHLLIETQSVIEVN